MYVRPHFVFPAHLSSSLDCSKLASRRVGVAIPEVDQSSLISEARVVLVDPTSAEEVLSVQIQSQDVLATDGMITMRPHQLIEGTVQNKETANVTHYSLEALERTSSQYLGRRGSIVGTASQCTFTQRVTPHAGSPFVFDLRHDPPRNGLSDDGGVELSFYWQGQPPQPPLPRLGTDDWPPFLSQKAIDALSNIPLNFHRELNPPPIHGTDIAGEYFQSVR
jgi:hypothetical protein